MLEMQQMQQMQEMSPAAYRELLGRLRVSEAPLEMDDLAEMEDLEFGAGGRPLLGVSERASERSIVSHSPTHPTLYDIILYTLFYRCGVSTSNREGWCACVYRCWARLAAPTFATLARQRGAALATRCR